MENNNFVYTEEQLMARLRFFIGVCLALTLTGIVFVVLYSLIFVTQPLNAISPIDQKFFELIVPIATFLTGTLSGIMLAGGDKELKQKAIESANKGWDKSPPPTAPNTPPSAPSANFNNTNPFGGTLGSSRIEPVLGMPTLKTDSVSSPAPIVTGFGGKPGPAPTPQPEI